MLVTVKLFASLTRFLPAGASGNEARVEVEQTMSLESLIARLGLPHEQCHLVLVNGAYIEPSRRAVVVLRPEDVIAVWPNVAGG